MGATPSFHWKKRRVKPPRRFLIRWFDRLGPPGSVFLSSLPLILAMMLPISTRQPVLLWAGATVILCIPIFYVQYMPHKYPGLNRWIGPDSNGWLGIFLWLWMAAIYLYSASHLALTTLVVIWPVFTLPFVIFIIGRSQEQSITSSVLLMTTASLTVLVAGGLISSTAVDQKSEAIPPANLVAIVFTLSLSLFILIYYAVRRSQLYQIRAEAFQELMFDIIDLEDPIRSADTVARLLYERADVGKRVLVLFYNQHLDDLRVVAFAGEGAEKAKDFQIPRDKGISRRAIQGKRTVHVDDVGKDPDFVSGGLPKKGSEIAVPILIEDEDGSEYATGTINVQEDVKNGFSAGDIATVEKFAELIALVSRKYYSRFQERMTSRMQALNSLISPEDMAEEIVEIAQEIFDCPLVCYLRLAPGTGFPLPRPVLRGDFEHPEYFSDPALYQSSSNLIQWIVAWENRFIDTFSTEDALLAKGYGFGKAFQEQEETVSMCFLPIGTLKMRLGILLVFFSQKNVFSRYERMNLVSFASEIAPHLLRAEFLTSLISGFARPQLHLHSLLGELGAKGAWEMLIRNVCALPDVKDSRMDVQLEIFRDRLHQFIESVRLWDATQRYTIFLGSRKTSLETALSQSFLSLEHRYGGKVNLQFDPLIEEESSELKLIVFSIVTEAVRNSYIHSEMSSVEVFVGIRRYPEEISLDISDDGQGFDPKQLTSDPDEGFEGGITDLINLAERLLHAETKWIYTAPNRGAYLSFRIPVLPGQGAEDQNTHRKEDPIGHERIQSDA